MTEEYIQRLIQLAEEIQIMLDNTECFNNEGRILNLRSKLNHLLGYIFALSSPQDPKEKCYCQCHALDNFGWDQKTKQCKHCSPLPKKEEETK